MKQWFKRKPKKEYTQSHIDKLRYDATIAVEESYKRGFDNGREQGYNEGKADGINIAKEAAKQAIQRRYKHGTQETNPR